MNAAQLLAHFDRISDVPDGVPRLRRFILDLAVRGKLVEQDPKENPAPELLALLSSCSHESQFNLSSPWIRAKVGDLLDFRYGKALPPGDRLDQGRVPVFGSNGVVAYCLEPLSEEPAIIIGRKGSAGALNLCAGPSWTMDVAYFVNSPPFFDIRFLFIILQTLDLGELGKGVKPGLSRNDAYQLGIAVPPLPEQHRIVAKVDELMALCDGLEAAQAERENCRDRLTAASLHRLNNGANAEAFRESARFHLDHLPRLTTRPQHIKQLRQTILNLAVRGRLVSQDPDDEPASVVIAISDKTRAEVAKEDSRADRENQSFLNRESCWKVPSSWECRCLADLTLFIDYRGRTPPKVERGVRLITAKNVKKGFLSLSPAEFVSQETYNTWMTRGFPREGDVLLTTEAPMGSAAVVRLTERFALAQRVICLRPYGALNSDFLALQLIAEPFQSILGLTATGLTAKGIKAAKLKRLPVAVPPLAEQHRIVTKVDELMALCDQLDAQLTATQTESRRLLDALLHQALSAAPQAA